MTHQYYSVPPDIAMIPMKDGKILFRSDNLAITLEGPSVPYLMESIFPSLDGITPLSAIAQQHNIEPDELQRHLDDLVAKGVLRSRSEPLQNEPAISTALDHFLERIGIDPRKAATYLQQKNVVVAGLEGAGVFIAAELLQSGITRISLLDPFPFQKGELFLFPFLDETAVGKPRQEVFRSYFEELHPDVHIALGPVDLTRESVYEATGEKDFLIGSFDKGFISAHHWLNQAAMEQKVPALFVEVENHLCRIGPLVLPGETACFMCYRMRGIACADNFTEAMAYETHVNNQKNPTFHLRGFLPSSLHTTAGIAAGEVIKLLLSIDATLSSRILEFDTITLDVQKHYVLQKPDCPVCFKKKGWERTHPSLEELHSSASTESVIAQYRDILISDKTGIIKHFEPVPKSPTEPAVPYTIGVTLSNHLFVPKEHSENETCSGKGTSLKEAEISALGEGVERYSGACFRLDEIHYSPFEELEGLKLHPAQLVLHADDQYEDLDVAPFDPSAPMGWAMGYSLVQHQAIQVPALSVFMNYPTRSKREYICAVSSNGLAAGATLLNAVLSAALEVIERDAFLVTWYHELRCQKVDPLTLPDKAITEYCMSYSRRGVEMLLFRLPTDFPVHVFMGVGYQASGKDGPSMVVGLGADPDPVRAARGALLEIGQVRPALKHRMATAEAQDRLKELLADPSLVATLEDHSLLYASPESVHAFAFLFDRPVEAFDWLVPSMTASQKLQTLVDHQRAKESDFIYYNLTPPDMEKLGLYTARVILPDLQPIHFGEKNIRLGGHRLYHLPAELGLKKGATTRNDLNKNPHPLA